MYLVRQRTQDWISTHSLLKHVCFSLLTYVLICKPVFHHYLGKTNNCKQNSTGWKRRKFRAIEGKRLKKLTKCLAGREDQIWLSGSSRPRTAASPHACNRRDVETAAGTCTDCGRRSLTTGATPRCTPGRTTPVQTGSAWTRDVRWGEGAWHRPRLPPAVLQ